MARYTFTPKGKSEFADPESWARNDETIKLCSLLAKGVDAEKLTDKQRGRCNRWATLGFVKRTEKTTPSKSVRTSPPKTTAELRRAA